MAHCYAGHQFGYFAGQLGDGRACTLGEVTARSTSTVIEVALKGSGPTPFSRQADGRAVLRSSVREMLCSEAMAALGVPTSRAPLLVASDKRTVVRDLLYDGNPIMERPAVLMRTAPSFLRFGSFEVFKEEDEITGSAGPHSHLPAAQGIHRLVDFLVDSGHVPGGGTGDPASRALAYLRWVSERTADLIARWLSVGFVHGVMNTDNMSAVAVTLDYGPFGFMEAMAPLWACNHSDKEARYCFAAQGDIGRWNVCKLAEAMAPALVGAESSFDPVQHYDVPFAASFDRLFARKLGFELTPETSAETRAAATSLTASLLATMESTGADFTNTFRSLARVEAAAAEAAVDPSLLSHFVSLSAKTPQALAALLSPSLPRHVVASLQRALAGPDADSLRERLGPKLAMVQEQIARAANSAKVASRSASEHQADVEAAWRKWLESYQTALAAHIPDQAARKALQNRSNPRIVLRNWIAERAIRAAEAGDYSETARLLETFKTPFDEAEDDLAQQAPEPTLAKICVSCSS